MKRRVKICVVTATRAEYGLLYWLLKELDRDEFFELQLVVTGAHLSSEYGNTINEIKEDGFIIHEQINILDDNSDVGIALSISKATLGIAKAFERLSPDLTLILGDRYEMVAVALTSVLFKIPIVHLYGGEITEGAYDDVFRHAITKMSSLHLVATESFMKRIIQLGESPDTVKVVGSIGIENIKKLSYQSIDEFENSISFKLGERSILFTYHPETLRPEDTQSQIREILAGIDSFPEANVIFTMPNSDSNSTIIDDEIKKYVKSHPGRALYVKSLGRKKYLHALKYVDVVMGNSSSALIEAPSFATKVINIGDRQKGRPQASNVINVNPQKNAIANALKELFSDIKQSSVAVGIINPYGDGNTSDKIIDFIKKRYNKIKVRKKFFDLDFTY